MKTEPTQVRRWLLVALPVAGAGLAALGLVANRFPPAGPAAFPGAPPAGRLGTPPPGAVPGDWLQSLLAEALRDHTLLMLAAIVLVATLVQLVSPAAVRRIRTSVLLYGAYLVLLPIGAAFLSVSHLEGYFYLRGAAELASLLTLINLGSALLFDVVLSGLRLPLRPILRELLTGAAYLVAALLLLGWSGVELGRLLTTSAILTAVVGLSIQSTLGDAVSGLFLELEDAIQPGDWLKVGDLNGLVKEIRWRHTAIETRNWETVLVPNSVIMKNQVLVLGRRHGAPVQWRRWIYFNVDFSVAPGQVIAAVDEALQAAPMERVAAQPAPHCILFDIRDSNALYAARYWLTDLAVDDPTDSLVRIRIHAALRRAGIPLAVPRQTIGLEPRDEAGRAAAAGETEADRRRALRRFELFGTLSEDEVGRLIADLRHAPFARGEVMTREGAEAHWLYLIVRGRARVVVRLPDGSEQEVAQLGPGDYFGEMAILTGQPRRATVVASSDCDCWRLGVESFRALIHARPELAEELSQILAARRRKLESTVEASSGAAPHEQDTLHLSREIRRFFGL